MSCYFVVGVPLTSVYENDVQKTAEPRFNPKTGKPIAPQIVETNQRKVMGLMLAADEQEENHPENWCGTLDTIKAMTKFELVNVDNNTDYDEPDLDNFAIGLRIGIEEGVHEIPLAKLSSMISEANSALRGMGISHEAQLLVAYEKDYD